MSTVVPDISDSGKKPEDKKKAETSRDGSKDKEKGKNTQSEKEPNISRLFKKKKAQAESPLSKSITMEKIMSIEFEVQTNNVINAKEKAAIEEIFRENGISDDIQQDVSIDIVRCCVDVGSSMHSVVPGKSQFCEFERSEIVGFVKEVTTLRRFCMFFAKIIWNMLLSSNTPPANWSHKGFKYKVRFAAFDFLTGVMDECALSPQGGLIREPTQLELNANLAYMEVSAFRQDMADGMQSLNLGEISGGNSGRVAHNPFSK